MKELLLSFIMPLKMKRFRFMSVFVAIFIFVVSIYFIALPNQFYMKSHKDLYLSQKAYVNAYLDLPESLTMSQEFINSQYKVNDKYEMVSSATNKEIKIYSFEDIDVQLINEQPKSVDFYVVFDEADLLTTELNQIKDEYSKKYADDSQNKVAYASYIYYVEKLKINDSTVTNNDWKITKFEELHNTEESKLQEEMAKISNFDLFGIPEDDDNYLLVFLKTSLVTQIPHYDQNSETVSFPALSTYYQVSEMKFDFTNIKTFNEFGNYFAELMFEPLSNTDQTEYLIQVVGYVLIFPAIFVLLLCWSLKKRGVMKTYKEYYNVASIASIIPLLVTFLLSWFIPKVAPIYGALFCVFVLFAFIRINSTPELGD